jgi:hypothetical protein
MTSAINTNGINVNYPVPGINNSSQGFRDNFSVIKTDLNTAATEITDLQNNVVLKSALNGITLNNDMANTLISNALTRGFRASTYNLGNAISGIVTVNASLGDVQYGTIAGDTIIQLTGWAPSGTQSNVELQFAVSNSNATITFPSAVANSNTLSTIENFVSGTSNITIPYGVTQLDFRLSSIDCGNTVVIEPYTRARQTAQIQQRTPAPTGFQGDVAGDVALGDTYNQLTISSSNSSDYFTTGNTSQLYTDLPIVFTGVTMEANITIGTTYYVRNVVSSTTFTVSSTIGGANVNLAGNSSPTSSMYGNPVSYTYVCTGAYDASPVLPAKSVSNTTASTNVITMSNTNDLVLNAPIVFAGTTFGGIVAGVVYYIKSIPGGTTITVSRSRTNGVADTVVELSTASGTCSATSYNGSNIWKRIALTAW